MRERELLLHFWIFYIYIASNIDPLFFLTLCGVVDRSPPLFWTTYTYDGIMRYFSESLSVYRFLFPLVFKLCAILMGPPFLRVSISLF